MNLKKVSHKFKLVIILLLFSLQITIAQNTISATYNSGNISTSLTDFDPDCTGSSTTLSFILPPGENVRVDSISISYDFQSISPYAPAQQQSRVYCQNTYSEEAIISGSVGIQGGLESYIRSGVSIANSTYSGGTELIFEMRAWRSSGASTVCDAVEQYITDGTWTITVYHSDAFITPKVGVNTNTPKASLDIAGKLKIADDNAALEAGNIRYNSDKKDFEGYEGQVWKSLTSESRNETPYYIKKDQSNIPVYTISPSSHIFSDSSAIIYDSGGPNGNYGANEVYFFTINNPGLQLVYGIKISIDSFDVDVNDALFLPYENGEALNGTNMESKVFFFETNNNILNILFYSDNSVEKSGFRLRYDYLFYKEDIEMVSPPPFSSWHYNQEKKAVYGGLHNELSVDSIGKYSINYGNQSKSSGDYSIAFGNHAKASGDKAFAVGDNAVASGFESIALNGEAYGYNSIAIDGIARGDYSRAFGGLAIGSSSYANGGGASAYGEYSVCINSGSFANVSRSYGKNSLAIGSSVISYSGHETALGRYNTQYTAIDTFGWNSNDRLFVIGNGTASNARNDAFTIIKNGKTGIGISSPSARLQVDADAGEDVFLAQIDGVQVAKLDHKTFHLESPGRSVYIGKDVGINDDGTNNSNTAIGYESMRDNLIGDYSVGVGYHALRNSTGHHNVAVGAVALIDNISGNYNTAMGTDAGKSNTGSNNLFLGFEAGKNNLGSSNIFIGHKAGRNQAGNNQLFIENSSSGTPLIYGNFTNNQVGIGTSNPAARLQIDAGIGEDALRVKVDGTTKFKVHSNGGVKVGSNGTPEIDGITIDGGAVKPGGGSWTAPSDRRLKDRIINYNDGLNQLKLINPVTYHYNVESSLPTKKEHVGVIAQELQKVAPYMVSQNEETGYLQVDFSAATYMLINAVKEQQEMIEEQKEILNKQQEAIDQLIAKVTVLEGDK